MPSCGAGDRCVERHATGASRAPEPAPQRLRPRHGHELARRAARAGSRTRTRADLAASARANDLRRVRSLQHRGSARELVTGTLRAPAAPAAPAGDEAWDAESGGHPAAAGRGRGLGRSGYRRVRLRAPQGRDLSLEDALQLRGHDHPRHPTLGAPRARGARTATGHRDHADDHRNHHDAREKSPHDRYYVARAPASHTSQKQESISLGGAARPELAGDGRAHALEQLGDLDVAVDGQGPLARGDALGGAVGTRERVGVA
jgi:hypothetical protein